MNPSFFQRFRNHIYLHLIILIWGFTGILGKLISISSVSLVWYRMSIALVGLIVFFLVTKRSFKVQWLMLAKLIGTGLIIAGHWILFFEAIKVSNVSVTLACLSSASLFTAVLEPLFFKRRIIPYELVLGGAVIAGLYLIFRFETNYTLGIIYSLISAFLAALFTVINGQFIKTTTSSVITIYEMLGGVLGITIYYTIQGGFPESLPWPSMADWGYLLILGLICTALAFLVSVEVMKELSPYTVSISINMEPIYAIILALLFFGDTEYMSSGFYFGAGIILLTIFGNALLKNKFKAKNV